MNPQDMKRQMLQDIMKMASEARMTALKAKHAPPPPVGEEKAAPMSVPDADDRPPAVGEHMDLSDDELKELLAD